MSIKDFLFLELTPMFFIFLFSMVFGGVATNLALSNIPSYIEWILNVYILFGKILFIKFVTAVVIRI